jgi:hypothetical protein
MIQRQKKEVTKIIKKNLNIITKNRAITIEFPHSCTNHDLKESYKNLQKQLLQLDQAVINISAALFISPKDCELFLNSLLDEGKFETIALKELKVIYKSKIDDLRMNRKIKIDLFKNPPKFKALVKKPEELYKFWNNFKKKITLEAANISCSARQEIVKNIVKKWQIFTQPATIIKNNHRLSMVTAIAKIEQNKNKKLIIKLQTLLNFLKEKLTNDLDEVFIMSLIAKILLNQVLDDYYIRKGLIEPIVIILLEHNNNKILIMSLIAKIYPNLSENYIRGFVDYVMNFEEISLTKNHRSKDQEIYKILEYLHNENEARKALKEKLPSPSFINFVKDNQKNKEEKIL